MAADNNVKVKNDPFAIGAGVPEIDGSLRPKPKTTDRISSKVIFLAIGFVAMLAGLFLAALDQMDVKKTRPPAELSDAPSKPSQNTKRLPLDVDVLGSSETTKTNPKKESPSLPKLEAPVDKDAAEGSVAAPRLAASAVPPMGARRAGAEAAPIDTGVPRLNDGPGGRGDAANPPPLTPEQQAVAKAKSDRLQRMALARAGGLGANGFSAADGVPVGGAPSSLLPKQQGFTPVGGMAQLQAAPAPDPKDEFLEKANKEVPSYHPFVSRPALAANRELKTGSFIPMTLEMSINSDLPGQLTARVTEDVYDSSYGCRLLIPAMAKVVGRYDSKIALGQGRMLVAWNTVVFPDGSELNLAGMQAYDTSGQAGLESDVDNHYWRMFGLTFGLSLISAGVQSSVPQPNPTTGGAAAPQTPAQILAVSLAQQYGTLGAQIISRYMSVQPTLRNFAGERFIVVVPRTIVFPKIWRVRCKGGNAE